MKWRPPGRVSSEGCLFVVGVGESVVERKSLRWLSPSMEFAVLDAASLLIG